MRKRLKAMIEGCVGIDVMGEALVADASGALYWPAEKTLIVSDLHFEKGSSYAVTGQMLPPYDTRATLKSLSAALERHRPTQVLALGDSFHDEHAGGRLGTEDMSAVQDLTQRYEWTWITGNHDEILPDGIGGTVAQEVSINALSFRHEPSLRTSDGELCGHLHPCAIVRTRSRKLRRRCFVGDGRRLILPAFGAYTGGLDIADDAYAGLFTGLPTAWVMGRSRVYTIPPKRLVGLS